MPSMGTGRGNVSSTGGGGRGGGGGGAASLEDSTTSVDAPVLVAGSGVSSSSE